MMVEYQTVSIVFTGLSISLAAFYYVNTLRNARLSRQAQLFMQVYNAYSSVELHRNYIELINYEWNDYDDFESKYGSDTNEEAYSKRASIWLWFNGMGLLVEKGLVDPEMVYFTAGNQALYTWAKFGDIIKELGRRYNVSDSFEHFEYLVGVLKKISEKRGSNLGDVPETFARYIPDQ